MTASRTGGSSGIAAMADGDAGQDVLAERVAAQEAEAGREGDERERDDEQDPDQPVELALERRPPPLARGEAARDLPELGRPPDRDDDALAAATDDARPRVGHGSPAGERRVGRIGRRPAPPRGSTRR